MKEINKKMKTLDDDDYGSKTDNQIDDEKFEKAI